MKKSVFEKYNGNEKLLIKDINKCVDYIISQVGKEVAWTDTAQKKFGYTVYQYALEAIARNLLKFKKK